MSKSISVYQKISDVTVEELEYTNKETGELIEYNRVYVHLKIQGEEETLELVPTKSEGKSAYRVLKLADDIE